MFLLIVNAGTLHLLENVIKGATRELLLFDKNAWFWITLVWYAV